MPQLLNALQTRVGKYFGVVFIALALLASGISGTVFAADGSGTNSVSPTSTTVSSTGNTFTFTYTAAETMNSGGIQIVMPSASGWSAPTSTSGVGGRTTATSASGVIADVEDTADSATGWGVASGGCATAAPVATTTIKQEGTASIVCRNGNQSTGDLWFKNITAQDWSGYSQIGFWIRSSAAVVAGRLQFSYDNTASLASPLENISVGALSANTWKYVVLSFGATTRTAVASFGFRVNNNGAVDNARVYADDFLLGPGSPTFPGGGAVNVRVLQLAGTQTVIVTYGAGGGTSGVTAPSSAGTYTATTTARISDAGTLTNIASQPTVTVLSPAATLTSISPTSTTVGASNFSLAANGSNFVSGVTVNVNGVQRTASFISSSLATTTILSSDLNAAGTISITVTNPGTATSSAQNLTINKANTTTSVTSTVASAIYGTSATFTATVTPSAGPAPSGSVTFKDGATTLGTGTLNGANPGVATFTTSSLNVAGSPHSITAVYGGDSNFNVSTSSAISQAVTVKALTVINITANNKAYDTTTIATLNTNTATLSGVVGGDAVTLVTSTAVGTFATSTVGNNIVVTISGLTINGAQSGNYSLTQPTTTANITQATQATLTATSTPGIVIFGNTSTISSSGGSGTGAVTFSAGASTGCSVSVTTLSVTSATGTCAITATKAADTNYLLATSTAVTVTLQKATQATLVAVSTPSSLTYGATSTLSTTGGSGTGAVTFDIGASTGCSITSGTVLNVTSATGTCAVTATKAADNNYNQATSAPLTVTLSKGTQTTLVAVSTPSTVVYGNTSTLSSTGGNGNGAVTFSAGASTGCSVLGTTLSVTNAGGTCSITATKAADNNYNQATSAPLTVTLSAKSITVTAQAATKVYGSADPAFTYNSSDASTTFSGALSRVAGESVGTYAMTTGTLAVVGNNYIIGSFVSADLTITNPSPVLNSISPTSTIAGGSGFTLTLNGSGFVPESVANWNGSARTTTYVTSTQLTAAILSSDITSAGTSSVSVTNSGPGGGTSASQTFTIESGVATQFSLSHPGSMGAGTRAIYTVTRKDVNGNATTFGTNVVYMYTTGASSTSRFYDAASGGNIITNVTISSGASTATFYYYDEVPGTKTVTASDNSSAPDFAGITDATDTIVVNTGATTQFLLNDQVSLTAGERAAYTVTREDGLNNLVTSGLDTVYLYTTATSSGVFYNAASGGSVITSIQIVNGSSTTNFWYYDTAPGTKTVTASDKSTYPPDGPTGISDATDSITVVAGPTAQYLLSGPASSYAKTRAGFTVARKDSFGNFVTSGTSTVYMYTNSSSSNAKFFNDSLAGSQITSIDIASGQSSASVWYYDDTPADVTLTASDNSSAPDGGAGMADSSATITILPVAVKFVIIQPTNGSVDAPITVTVQAQKPDNSVDTNYQSDVTLNLAGTATTTGGGLVDIINGEGTKNISDTLAETITLSLSDSQTTGLDVSSSKQVTFSAGNLAQFTLNHPGTIGAGTRASYTVTREDQYGNLITAGSSTVYLYTNSSSSQARFYADAVSTSTPITSIVISPGNSTANFWYYDQALGSWTVAASDNASASDGNAGVNDALDSLTVVPGAVASFTLNHSAAIEVNTRAAYTVTRRDAFNNLVTSGATSVYLYSSSLSTSSAFYLVFSGGTPQTLTTITDTNSAAQFWYTDGVANTYTITVSDSSSYPGDGATGIADATDSLVVSPAPIVATKLVILDPGTVTVDSAVTITVQAQDNSGSVDTSYSGSVTLNANGSATGGGTVTIAGGSGTKNISDTLAQTVNLSLTNTFSIALDTTFTRTLTFAPGALAQYSISSPGDMPAGTRQALTVSRKDQFGNGVVSGLNTAYLYSASSNPNKRFYDSASGGSSMTFVNFSTGVTSTQVWYYDETAATTTATISDNATSSDGTAGIADGSTFVHIVPASVAKFILNNPGDMFAGTRLGYTVSRQDAFGNNVFSGITLVRLYSNSTGASKKFYDAATSGNIVTSVPIDDGNTSANFWYYDETAGSWNITASDNATSPDGSTGIIDAVDSVTVSLVPIVATRFVIVPSAGPFQIGTAVLISIQAEDSSGNVQTDYNNSVTLNVTGSATGGGVVTVTNGVGVASVTDFTAETVNLTLTDSNSTGLNTSSVGTITFQLEPVLIPGFAGGGTPLNIQIAPVVIGGVTFAGRAYPGAKLSIVALGNTATILRQSTVASASGIFQIDFRGISTGSRSYGLLVQDVDGRAAQSKTFDVNLVNKSDILQVTNIITSPTIGFSRPTVTKGDRLIVLGYSTPGSTIKFQVDGKPIIEQTTAGSGGAYRVLIRTGEMDLGSHVINAQQTDNFGRTSDFSPTKVFNVSNLLVPQVDFNDDGKVNITDASIFISRWNSTDPKVRILDDLNSDGKVDASDFSIFIRTLRLK